MTCFVDSPREMFLAALRKFAGLPCVWAYLTPSALFRTVLLHSIFD